MYSCLFTLLLCVYTAIHLNIPDQRHSQFWFWLRKTKYVVIAILAPEIVVYIAFEQWYLSRQFLKKLHGLAQVNQDEKFKVGDIL
jgi:hypothetical protein